MRSADIDKWYLLINPGAYFSPIFNHKMSKL